MPDRPKRRRNNKNKRKNKNAVQPQHEKLLSDSRASSTSETCDTEITDELCEKETYPSSTSDNGCKSNSNISSRKSSDNLNNLCDLNQSFNVKAECKQEDVNGGELPQTPQININSQKTVNDVLAEIKCINNYIVESPKQSSTNLPKLANTIKSRSLDNDDVPKITEITDDTEILSEEEGKLPVIDGSNTIVSEADSDVEWETADTLDNDYMSPNEVAVGTLNIQTIPLNVAQCEHNQVLTPEEELSLRQYLQSLDLTTHPANVTSLEVESRVEVQSDAKHKLKKKGMAEDFFRPRIPVPRFLDVIDEEGSSESSATSKRQSQLSETKNDFDDLEDDVFIDTVNQSTRSERHPILMGATNRNYKRLTQNIPQECFLVGAKIVESKIMEAKGDWTVKTVEKMKGAEVVYLTDSSSSASDIYDINDEIESHNDTDASVRIITPTIEVTDTESLLKSVAQNEASIFDQEKIKINVDDNKSILNNDASIQKRDKPTSNFTDFRSSDESHPHEILVLSTDNIQTDLYVLDSVEETKQETEDGNKISMVSNNIPMIDLPVVLKNNAKDDITKTNASTFENNINQMNESHDVEIKLLKCELNDAFNNLLKEVSSDSDVPNEETLESFQRQDSSSSIGSSQCTAKYNPNYSSTNDLGDTIHEETVNTNNEKQKFVCTSDKFISSHVRDVLKAVSAASISESKKQYSMISSLSESLSLSESKLHQPEQLREICVKKIATFPYGEKILEELASVSERLQNINIISTRDKTENQTIANDKQIDTLHRSENVSYPLIKTSVIDKHGDISTLRREITPPPIKPRRSSRKKSQENMHWDDTSTKTEPVYVCLSPSQKMLMEKTNTKITKEDISSSNDICKKTTEKRGSDNQSYKPHEEKNQTDKMNSTFKSQTGNRLLAILRDPTITNSINRVNKSSLYKSLDNLSSSCKHWETKLTEDEKHQQLHLPRKDLNINSFKPIPPPRPRYYSSTTYESDENSDFANNSFRSMKSEKKIFHYSTGNLSKEIENDITSIQNLHRNYTSFRNNNLDSQPPRRPSLPKELFDVQMDYIRKKELDAHNEIHRLESQKIISPDKKVPRAPLIKDSENSQKFFSSRSHNSLHKKDTLFNKDNIFRKPLEEKKSSFRSSQEELMRERMYSEYICEMAERHERKQQKIIKITNNPIKTNKMSRSLSALHLNDIKANNVIEEEFISKAKERWNKLGIKDPETEDERETRKDVYREPKVIEHKIKVIEGGAEQDVQKLPKHLQDFVRFTAKNKEHPASDPAIWRPGAPSSPPAGAASGAVRAPRAPPPPPPPPVWTPGSAGTSPRSPRRTFRPVHFEETPPPTRKLLSTVSGQNGCGSESESESRGLRTSLSAPASGLHALGEPAPAPPPFARLPRAQNPTVTLLQKAREGQISKGANYALESDSARLPRDRATPPKGDPVHALRREYASESEAEKREYERASTRRMADTQKKVEVGPTTRDGMPVSLRSEVRDPSRWYKKMYDTIHKTKLDDDCVTIRYKSRRGQPIQRVSPNKSQYAYFDPRSGYLSEPEGGFSRLGSSTWSDAYDSDVTTGPRRRTASVQEERHHDDITSPYLPSNKYSTLASARASQEVYKNQPGRIEDYVPGKSSVVDKEAKQWWDEVMDIFDGQLSSTTSLPQASPKEKKDITSAILSKSNMARALKESGYESDSTLVFRRRDDTEPPLSPAERRAAYRDLQAGGEPPLRGFRSPAPPRQDETEIEYIPISPTLTKIRVHKKKPQEIICYPIIDKQLKFLGPPAPPRRVSSKNNRTLRLATSIRPSSISPRRAPDSITQTNIDFLKDKINSKLTRQGTQILSRKPPVPENKASVDSKVLKHSRFMSTSAPPAIDRKKSMTDATKANMKCIITDTKSQNTSSFSSPRRTLLPTEYTNPIHSKFTKGRDNKVIIEGGAGRRTPISNILDRVTPLDKLWNSEKRNEPYEISKGKLKPSKSINSMNVKHPPSLIITKNSVKGSPKLVITGVTHRGRDMIRTSDKLQKLKPSNLQAKSLSSINTKIEPKTSKVNVTPFISKSASTASLSSKKNVQVKTASVANLRKKQCLESVTIRPRSVPCHASCTKKFKENGKTTKKQRKQKNDKKTGEKYISSESGSQFGDTSNEHSQSGSTENIIQNRPMSSREIKEQHNAVVSDTFFQHLFLGNLNILSDINKSQEECTSVLQKAKLFQKLDRDISMPKALNSYLIMRKPVSESKFKILDSYSAPGRSLSPRSVSWPGRMQGPVRKFDSLLTKNEEFGSSSSLATIRSRSEPPINKMYFSQTSRPISPIVTFYKKEINLDTSTKRPPIRMIFSQTSRPVSPKVVHKILRLPTVSREESPSPTRFVSTETVRPISPVIIKPLKTLSSSEFKQETQKQKDKTQKTFILSDTSRLSSPHTTRKPSAIRSIHSRSHSTSPVTFRSPSYRRINSARVHGLKNTTDIGLHKKTVRTRSAGEVGSIKEKFKLPTKTHSDTNLPSTNDPDYEEYILDMQNTKTRSDRFRELNRYYNYLERVAELEKATSTCDLRHRKKDEEIIDFDRWKKIRSIERAEEELNNLYRKLKIAQTEKDVLFYPRDPDDFRWKYDHDRGLRIKEKSVEDLKDHFQQISESSVDPCTVFEIPPPKDSYKPLWRGTSVAETAFNINRRSEASDDYDSQSLVKPTIAFEQDSSLNELRKKLGLGNRLWSSLSMEQVNALKSQLNAIYSKDVESKSIKDYDKYIVDVTDNKQYEKTNLRVRSSSLISNDYSSIDNKDISKSQSIAAISYSPPTVKEIKNNVNKIQMALSENEKRKISQTLSKEVMNRVKKNEATMTTNVSIGKETIESNLSQNTEAQHEEKKFMKEAGSEQNGDNKRHVIFPIEKSASQHHSSASETDTISSDISSKTVIYRGPKKEVLKKIEYFESVKMLSDQNKTMYHARESSDEKKPGKFESKENVFQADITPGDDVDPKNKISLSQSCTNFKELFGESEKNKFLSLPSKTGRYSRSPSPRWEAQFDDRRTPDTLRYSSDEAICRSRSESPDPERHVRAYLRLARAGEVRRLARRFDSPTGPVAYGLRRHRSDPGLASPQTLYRHALSPVARVPLRPGNRFMPHIDIISKLASLRRRNTPRSHSFEEALECRPGEVERIRRRFETMSLLGQIYSSAPDVRELRDIAPYLAGPWIAHRYPKRRDNNVSLIDGSLVGGRTSPARKDASLKRPTKQSVKLSSILKSEDIPAQQEFNPTIHRPAHRYEPPRAPPRPPPAAWPLRLAPFVTPVTHRHTVTFKEGGRTPDPPRRAAYTSSSDTESPRRYLESDVNIHYRCPVRRDPLPLVPERELERQQADHMRRLYREQRRAKYLQELQDMQNRRHQDNFTPSQKAVVPLNRYDEAGRIVARALYTFSGQTPRELSFTKGEIINVRRQIDANWYEGELHGRTGLFPYNYVEILKGEVTQTQKRPAAIEGRARAKFDFTAQTGLELPLKKGEIVVLTRRIDHNWWEGRHGNKTGIFPDSYVTVLQEPSLNKPEPQLIVTTEKPIASPASHGLLNGSAKRSMGAHSYTPQLNSPALSNAPPATQPLPGYVAKPAHATLNASERGYGPPLSAADLNNTEPLYVDTNAEAVPYRAMYKYRPQNPDELELREGDTVYVLEKCDDGWYVGSSQRTGRLGTFPGNYVERI